MTRLEAEQLVRLLARLENARPIPPDYVGALRKVQALALHEMTAGDDSHSRRVPTLRSVP